jgi:hypothetical protein
VQRHIIEAVWNCCSFLAAGEYEGHPLIEHLVGEWVNQLSPEVDVDNRRIRLHLTQRIEPLFERDNRAKHDAVVLLDLIDDVEGKQGFVLDDEDTPSSQVDHCHGV